MGEVRIKCRDGGRKSGGNLLRHMFLLLNEDQGMVSSSYASRMRPAGRDFSRPVDTSVHALHKKLS